MSRPRWIVSALLLCACGGDEPLRPMAGNLGPDSPLTESDFCGTPTYNPATEGGLYLFEDCESGLWHLRAVAGGATRSFAGTLTSGGGFVQVTPVALESGDRLTTTATSVAFTLNVYQSGQDGVDFRLPAGAAAILTLDGGGTVLVGGGKLPRETPLSLGALALACGAPSYDPALEAAMVIWRDCSGGAWHVRFTAGGQDGVPYTGAVASEGFLSFTGVSIESHDVLDTSDSVAKAFDLRVSQAWFDGFDFTVKAGGSVSFDLSFPAAPTVLVGPDRQAAQLPLQLVADDGGTPSPPPPSPPPGNVDLGALGLVSVLDHGADPTGVKDSTQAIRQAVKAASDQGKVTFFPGGTYLVSDTIEMKQVLTNEDAGTGNEFILLGSKRGPRPVIRLKDGSPGFDACAGYPQSMTGCRTTSSINTSTCTVSSRTSLKPVLFFWKESVTCPGEPELSDGSRTYRNTVKHLDIVLGKNPGAVGIRHWGAEGCRTEDVHIDARGAFAGIYELIGSGGITMDVEVRGGKHGLYVPRARDGSQLVVGLKLSEQEQAPIHFTNWSPLSIVGFDISVPSGPVVSLGGSSNRGPHISFVDGSLRAQSDNNQPLIQNTDHFVYLKNVHVQGARTVARHTTDGSTLVVPDAAKIYRVGEYSFAGSYKTRFGDHAKLVKGVKTDATFLDGALSTQKSLQVSSTAAAVPPGLIASHVLPADLCDVEDPDMLDVKSAGAKGDGVADDTAALRQAIASAEQSGKDKVLLPRGTYRVSGTITLGDKTKLCGVSRSMVSIAASSSWKPSAQTPILATTDAAGGQAAASNLGVSSQNGNIYAIQWRQGRASIVDGVGTGMKGGDEGATVARRRTVITGGGGGRWYGQTHGSGYWQPQAEGARHILVQGTSEPLTFYGFHVQYLKPKGNPMVELRDCKNVTMFACKNEFLPDENKDGDYPPGTIPIILGIYGSENVGLYGMEGLAFADVGRGLVEVSGSSNVTLVNIARRPRTKYPADQWYFVRELEGEKPGILAQSGVALYKSN